MAAKYVVKVQYEDTMRRFTLERGELDFAQLEVKSRDLFKLAPSVPLLLTYTDKDGDEVTLASDDDLTDALVLQSINPLRLSLRLAATKSRGSASQQEPKVPAKSSSIVEENLPAEKSSPAVDNKLPEAKTSSAVEEELKAVKDLKSSEIPVTGDSEKNVEGTSDIPADSPTDPKEKIPDSGTPVVSPIDSKEKVAEKSAAAENGLPVHYGVQCDVCDVTPIKGSRYKSNTKENYDLCRSCFEAPSNPAPNEYTKIDRSFDLLLYPYCSMRGMQLLRPTPPLGNCCGTPAQKPASQEGVAGKGASSSAETSPNANTGPATADVETGARDQVQHHGVRCDSCGKSPIVGPRLISRTKWNYDLCLNCFEKSGEDTSKFLRVDEPDYRHPFARGRMLRLNAPFGRFGPVFWTSNAAQGADVKRTEIPVKESDNSVKKPGEVGNSGPGDVDSKEKGTLNATEENKPPVQTEMEAAPEAKVAENLSAAKEASLPPTAAPAVAEDDLSSEEGLLAKLAAMGFTDNQLNSDMLARNQFDLRKTVDDLCATEEWDPILEELQDMGFYDASINRNLLFKYNGNVKLVVKELVKLSKSENNGKVSAKQA